MIFRQRKQLLTLALPPLCLLLLLQLSRPVAGTIKDDKEGVEPSPLPIRPLPISVVPTVTHLDDPPPVSEYEEAVGTKPEILGPERVQVRLLRVPTHLLVSARRIR